MPPLSPVTRLACEDAVMSACCFHLPRSPALIASGQVYIVDVDPHTPERAVRARLQKQFGTPRVEVLWRTHRHMLVCVMFQPTSAGSIQIEHLL